MSYASLVPRLLQLLPKQCTPKQPIANRAYIHKSHRTITNKEAVFQQVQEFSRTVMHPGSEQRGEATNACLRFLPEKTLTTCFHRCCLRVQLLISLHLGADCIHPLWGMDGSWHTINNWEALRTKGWLRKSQSLERQPRAWAGLSDVTSLT